MLKETEEAWVRRSHEGCQGGVKREVLVLLYRYPTGTYPISKVVSS